MFVCVCEFACRCRQGFTVENDWRRLRKRNTKYVQNKQMNGVNSSCGIFNVILIRVLNEFTSWHREELLTKVCVSGRERE